MKSLEIDGVKIAEIGDDHAEFLKRAAKGGIGYVPPSPLYSMPIVSYGELAFSLTIAFNAYANGGEVTGSFLVGTN